MSVLLQNQLKNRLSFWEKLTLQQKEVLLAKSKLVSFTAGEHVHGGDTDCLGVLLVISGLLRSYLLSEDGKEATIYHLKPNDACLLSASCILEAVTFEVHIDAEEDTQAVLIPSDIFSELSDSNIHVENYSYKKITERFGDVISAMERMLFMSLEQRIAAFFIDEISRNNSSYIHLTHEQIARAIGSAREAVSRILKQMSMAGTIELFRGGLRVINKAFLYQLI
ncbi:MAG: Crp/Fnr family transcriptional regulator [Clostridiales bacterium]|nr:Crp/Fnr family transcriptional regulator [Clostridiales bacterium]